MRATIGTRICPIWVNRASSLLYAIEIPREGGDTEWSNQVFAYESLPTKLKK